MKDPTFNNIADNILGVLPVVRKKLLNIDLSSLGVGLSRLHLPIMTILYSEKMPISEVARQLLIPKPQMTRLVDQLVRLGMAERQTEPNDRRVINIVLTAAGKRTLVRCQRMFKENIRKKLSSLTEDELEELSASLEKIRRIGAKFE